MPKYVIEREIPGAGRLSREQLQAISQKSCGVLSNLGPQIQWVESYVMDDRVYCVYIAANEELIREHARQGGFPANRISEVHAIIDPTTAESPALNNSSIILNEDHFRASHCKGLRSSLTQKPGFVIFGRDF